MSQIKVLYIAGSNRCGSTLLARVLGDLPGFVAIGEALVHFFYGSSDDHVPCGCGQNVADCPFWKGISIPSRGDRVAARWLRLRRTAFLQLYLHRHPEQANQWTNSLRDFYFAIADHARAEVIVDSSKSPLHAILLSVVPNIDLHVVHLVRDPRSVAASSRRSKVWLPGASPLRATLRWLGMTLGSVYLQSRVSKSRTLRYEDFVRDPGHSIAQIMGDLGYEVLPTPLVNKSVVDLGPQHMLGSNPDKLRRGPTRITEKSLALGSFSRGLVSLLTAPALWKYGYWPSPTRDQFQPAPSSATAPPKMIVQETKQD